MTSLTLKDQVLRLSSGTAERTRTLRFSRPDVRPEVAGRERRCERSGGRPGRSVRPGDGRVASHRVSFDRRPKSGIRSPLHTVRSRYTHGRAGSQPIRKGDRRIGSIRLALLGACCLIDTGLSQRPGSGRHPVAEHTRGTGRPQMVGPSPPATAAPLSLL